MCVIMAKRCKLKGTKKDQWFLYKIRDRNYSPEYKLEVDETNGVETLFLIDQLTAWSEGINSRGLMIVSAALDNHTDLDDNGQSSAGLPASRRRIQKAKTLKKAIVSKNVDEAKQILVNGRFIGTSFISNGKRLIILEIYVNNDAFERETNKYPKNELEKLSKAQQIRKIMDGITPDDYDIKSHEVKKDNLAIRTNHGILLDDAGYQKDDANLEGYRSSIRRYNITKKAIKELGDDVHPFDVLTTLKNLKGIDPEPQNNPIRIKGKKDKDGKMPYYSSTVIMLTPTGTMFVIPLDSEVKNKNKLLLKPDREVDFVLLPKNLPLFESLRSLIWKESI